MEEAHKRFGRYVREGGRERRGEGGRGRRERGGGGGGSEGGYRERGKKRERGACIRERGREGRYIRGKEGYLGENEVCQREGGRKGSEEIHVCNMLYKSVLYIDLLHVVDKYMGTLLSPSSW